MQKRDCIVIILFFIANGFLVPLQVVERIGKIKEQGDFEH